MKIAYKTLDKYLKRRFNADKKAISALPSFAVSIGWQLVCDELAL